MSCLKILSLIVFQNESEDQQTQQAVARIPVVNMDIVAWI